MKPQISICVPSWNSLNYLKILYKGIKRNTKINYELIVHDNGSTDGTEDWLKENNIIYTKSNKNLGFCGVNNALKQSSADFVMIKNTDMYPLPFYDIEIIKQIKLFQSKKINRFTISCCLIEPLGANPEYTISYFGHDFNTFQEDNLIKDFLDNRSVKYKKESTIQYSHPILIPKFMLEEIAYLDEKYFPGWSVDHDLPKSLYEKGCRNFVMLGNSRVYHFISKTFTKLPNEVRSASGQDIFEKKWHMTVDEFRNSLNLKQPFDMRK